MSSPLKNPGQEVAKNTTFDTYPDPREFLRRGGYPGVSYLYVLSENCADATRKGWDSINGMPHFTVRGHSMTLMAKGRPSALAAPGTGTPIFFLDPKAVEKVGIGLDLKGKPAPAALNKAPSVPTTSHTPAPKPPPKPAHPNQR